MRPFQLLAFDLDGTLADSAPDILPALNQMMATLGKEQVSLVQVQHWLGNGMAMLIKRALTGQLEPEHCDSTEFNQAQQLFIDFYQQSNGSQTRLFDQVPEVLAQLSLLYPLAVVTNKPRQFTEPLLRHLGIQHFFKAIWCADDVDKAKPDPQMLLALAAQQQLPVTDILLVGDSENDIFAARAAGMPVIALSYGYNHGQSIAQSQPDLVLESFSLLPDAICCLEQER
ncbi:2-phosphoglycolate phosphatase [Rheinheimera sp. A13L]|uniref:phosphoglycolate phosphatase n=1 Tax=Rheinheimera sp. A13L TaxID=506534 RepID=UPI000212496E|nr:phosphoglycolate phosphatase [Rheinheimera sp. A13L]EGM76243.1 2-phosphoglycolate phosphatase [Rheinheimera sp. A13L]